MSVMSNTKVIEQVDKIVDAINGISGGGSSSAIISDVWDSTATYISGEYVIYQNILYKCLATTTPGIVPSEGIYWTIKRVSDELENITDDIDMLNSTMTKLTEEISCNESGTMIILKKIGANEGYRLIATTGGLLRYDHVTNIATDTFTTMWTK